MIPPIETERLQLRGFTLEDAPRMFDIYRSPDLLRYISLKPPKTITDVLNYLSDLMGAYPKCGFRAMFEKNTNELIGHCGLVPHSMDGEIHYEIAYLVAREFWNNGYATEAARKTLDADMPRLKISRVIALIDPGDRASQAVAEKLGLSKECDHKLPGGEKRLLFSKLNQAA